MKISVCLITFNGSSFLHEQIDSILAQSFPIEEIIVCDDASSDNTLNILNEYSLKYPELFKINLNETNIGAVANIQKAIITATGDIVFLADQDDIWMPNKVEVILQYFKQNPNIKGVITNGLVINEQGNAIVNTSLWETMSFPIKQLGTNLDLLKYITEVENFATGATMAFYTSLLFLQKPFPIIKGMFHDRWIALNLCLQNELGYIDQPLIKYRTHASQVIGGKKENQSYFLNNHIRLYKNEFKDISFKEYKDLVNKCNYNLAFNKQLGLTNAVYTIEDKICQLDTIAKQHFPFFYWLRKFKKGLSRFF